MTVDLAPGAYVAICFIPDPASDKPHFHLGIATTYTVEKARPYRGPAIDGLSATTGSSG